MSPESAGALTFLQAQFFVCEFKELSGPAASTASTPLTGETARRAVTEQYDTDPKYCERYKKKITDAEAKAKAATSRRK